MKTYYTAERNVQIVISLLKAHGISNIVASPGTTNITLLASMQQDPFFKMFSAADERSAAYIACGMAAETGRPVVLSCTGATASRNYLSGLTEAFYRKLPVLAITSAQHIGRIGNQMAQVIDRTVIAKDVAKISVMLPAIACAEDEWSCEVLANRAILELFHRGGGPVHINLVTTYSKDFSIKELPPTRVIHRITRDDKFPELPNVKIAIFVGAHSRWSPELTKAVDNFCAARNAVVLCDHTSNYHGSYRILHPIVFAQAAERDPDVNPDLIIHIGEISGDYYFTPAPNAQVWRVSPDGDICDKFKKLSYVFEMPEQIFFDICTPSQTKNPLDSYLKCCQESEKKLRNKMPENIPFSNIWIASQIAAKMPQNSIIHFGILNSLRAWNFFEMPSSVSGYCNTGGFGIDGCMSALLGASFVQRDKLLFGILGDLAFFYDMNSLGNRHISNNLRILLINNGKGAEFRNFTHPASAFGEDADLYIAAAGHYGNKSPRLVHHYAEDLGFEYLSATNKDEFSSVCSRFLSSGLTEKPIILEVFTDNKDESDALKSILYINHNAGNDIKAAITRAIGKDTIAVLKTLTKKIKKQISLH